MPDPVRFTKTLEATTLVAQDRPCTLTVECEPADAAVTWTITVPGGTTSTATGKSFTFTPTASHDLASIRVEASKDGQEVSVTTTVRVLASGLLLFDRSFANAAASTVIILTLIVLIPLVWLAVRLLRSDEPQFPALISTQLVIVGLVLAAAAAFAIFVELRGSMRSLADLEVLAGRAPGSDPTMRTMEGVPAVTGALNELVKAIPEGIKAFGQLRGPAALLVLSAVLMICATTIAWKAVPGSTPTPTPTVATSSPGSSGTGTPASPAPS
jgi:hypothetical protein